jgi:hypothetical protein
LVYLIIFRKSKKQSKKGKRKSAPLFSAPSYTFKIKLYRVIEELAKRNF